MQFDSFHFHDLAVKVTDEKTKSVMVKCKLDSVNYLDCP